MKALTVFLLLAVATQFTHADSVNYFKDDLVTKLSARSVIGNKIKAFLESLKESMKNGDESMGIPKLDPFDLEHQDIELDNELVSATGEVNGLHVTGLSDFDVSHADFQLGKKNFSIKLMWPSIKGNTLYDIIQAKFADFIPFFGKGSAKFEVTNLSFATNAKLKLDLKNKKIEIVEFSNTDISLDALKVDATGLYNDDELSEFMSGVISDLVPQVLVDFQKKITSEVNKIMLATGNKILPSIVDLVWEIIMPQN